MCSDDGVNIASNYDLERTAKIIEEPSSSNLCDDVPSNMVKGSADQTIHSKDVDNDHRITLDCKDDLMPNGPKVNGLPGYREDDVCLMDMEIKSHVIFVASGCDFNETLTRACISFIFSNLKNS